MKPKQHFEVGKYFLTTSQVLLGARVITGIVDSKSVEYSVYALSLLVATLFFVMGIYFVGKGD